MTPSPTELEIPEELYKYQHPIPETFFGGGLNHVGFYLYIPLSLKQNLGL